MKLSLAAALAFGAAAEAHCIFQRLSVNGKEHGQLEAIRAPPDNNPVQNVQSQDIVCGRSPSQSGTVIDVAPGDRLGAWFQHVLGGPQFAGDKDNPIAASHKGPVTAWLAKVDSAASAGTSGLKWFKVAEDGFDTGSKKWGVDNMIANNGWAYFTLPTCVAPGQYLLRVEILALHSARLQGQAQFYQSCAQINVGGSGTFQPSSTVSLPGAYSASDPSILINIYGALGQPDNDGKAYQAPGPRPITC